MARLRFGIVGTGYVADNYMFSARQYPETVEIVRAFDIVPAHAERFRATWDIPTVTTRAAFLDGLDVDMVINLTNPAAHAEVSTACLEAGFPVYSEKPLAMEFPDAEKLAALARDKGLTLSGAPCNHLGEAAQAIARTLRQGRIGKPVLAYAEADDDLIALAPVHLWKNVSGAPWPKEDEFEVGCTLEHVGYYLTWLVCFFGPIESVTAFASLQHPGKPVEPGASEGPDFSVATLKFASGAAARVTCSVVAPRDHGLKIFGTEGELHAEDCWFYQTPVSYRRWMRVRRRLMLSPWTNKVPLDPPPVAVKKGSTVGMDFIRGPVEAVTAAREGRPSRVATDFVLHVNEAALAIHHAVGGRAGTHAMTTTCTVPAPIPSPLDARAGEGFLDRKVPPFLDRLFKA
jgi:predicted dehydrogenase